MRKDRTGHDWTAKEDHHLVKRWGYGDSQEQIGRALGISKNAVAGRVIRLRSRGVDIPRRQGGDPALKQKMRQQKKANTKNAKLNPKVAKELRRHHAKTEMRRRVQQSTLPKIEDAPEPYLNPKPRETNYAAPGANSPQHMKSSAPKIDKIPEVAGTKCTTLLLNLKTGQCRYVHGFGEGKRFCDGLAKAGSSMCEPHHALCYRPSARQFDRAAARVSP